MWPWGGGLSGIDRAGLCWVGSCTGRSLSDLVGAGGRGGGGVGLG